MLRIVYLRGITEYTAPYVPFSGPEDQAGKSAALSVWVSTGG